jgi:hypothetical protein
MGTALVSPPNTSDPLELHHSYSSDFLNDPIFEIMDLAHDSDIDDPNLDDYKDAVISPQGSECPSKSSGPDPAMTLLQTSRGSIAQDQTTNHVDPPNFVDGELSSPSANASLGPVQTSEGDAEETPTVPGDEGSSKPSAPEVVAIGPFEPTGDGLEASQPATELRSPRASPIPTPEGDAEETPTGSGNEGSSKPSAPEVVAIGPFEPTGDGIEASQPTTQLLSPWATPLQHQPAAPLTIGDPNKSTCGLVSAEAATARHGKRAHDSDDGPATRACHSPSHAGSPVKKRKQSHEVIDLTGDDDDVQAEDDSRGWQKLDFRLKELGIRTDKRIQRYTWKPRSRVWEGVEGVQDGTSIDFKSVSEIITHQRTDGYGGLFTLNTGTGCFEGDCGGDQVSIHSAEIAVVLRERKGNLLVGYALKVSYS